MKKLLFILALVTSPLTFCSDNIMEWEELRHDEILHQKLAKEGKAELDEFQKVQVARDTPIAQKFMDRVFAAELACDNKAKAEAIKVMDSFLQYRKAEFRNKIAEIVITKTDQFLKKSAVYNMPEDLKKRLDELKKS